MTNIKIFPYNSLNLFLSPEDVCHNKELISLKNLFIQKTFIDNDNDLMINNKFKYIKNELFYFLHDLFMDQVFLGNDLIYITDHEIIWDNSRMKFFYTSKIFL